MATYILLMRHGEHEAGWFGNVRRRRLTPGGLKSAHQVGNRLNQLLKEEHPEGDVEQLQLVYSAPADEARATAEAVLHCLDAPPAIKNCDRLAETTQFNYAHKRGRLEKLAKDIREKVQAPGAAILVVGHQPLIGWLAYELTRKATPVARGGMLCIAWNGKRGRLHWVISPNDAAADQELKDKIRSKMDVAKVLIGFITAALGFLLGGLAGQNSPVERQPHCYAIYAGAACLFVAVMFYLAALYAYDSLLMPTRFWSEVPKNPGRRPRWVVKRPPSSSIWVRYQNMIRIWNCLFTPGTCAMLLGLAGLTFAVLRPSDSKFLWFDGAFLGIASVLTAACYIASRAWVQRLTGPWLGSED